LGDNSAARPRSGAAGGAMRRNERSLRMLIRDGAGEGECAAILKESPALLVNIHMD